jgi:hypothetical protein
MIKKWCLKTVVISLFLVIEMIPLFGQKNVLNEKNGWWLPIIHRLNIDLDHYNFSNGFTLVKPDTAFNERCIELGKTENPKARNVVYTEGLFISKANNDSIYYITRSEVVHHDFENDIMIMEKSTIEEFPVNSNDQKPISSISVDLINFDLKTMTMKIN